MATWLPGADGKRAAALIRSPAADADRAEIMMKSMPFAVPNGLRTPLRELLRGAGPMLRTLVRLNPATLVSRPGRAEETNPAFFRPEGHPHVAFCPSFARQQHPSEQLNDTRNWWSFRENVTEDPRLAIAFLDVFAGDEPEWVMPELFRTGQMRAVADRFLDRRGVDVLG